MRARRRHRAAVVRRMIDRAILLYLRSCKGGINAKASRPKGYRTMKNPYLFDLVKSKPAVKKKSGTVQGCYEGVFPIVTGQKAAMFLVVLKPRGIREPHWHPTAWEFDYCISGRARMSVVAPDNEWKIFDVKPGQVVFVPQGYFHYFENIGRDDLHFLVVFNNSSAESDDDIGISVSLGGVPNHVLARTSACRQKYSTRSPSCTRKSSSSEP